MKSQSLDEQPVRAARVRRRGKHLDVIVALQTSMLPSERRNIAELEAAMRLPVIYVYREHVVDGA
jgi:hypothetical protein